MLFIQFFYFKNNDCTKTFKDSKFNCINKLYFLSNFKCTIYNFNLHHKLCVSFVDLLMSHLNKNIFCKYQNITFMLRLSTIKNIIKLN